MTTFARTDTSVVGRWWWTVDRWTIAALACIIGVGAVLILAASPAAVSAAPIRRVIASSSPTTATRGRVWNLKMRCLAAT